MNAPEIKRSSLADAFKGAGSEDAAELTGLLAPRKPSPPREAATPAPASPDATESTPNAPEAEAAAAVTPEPREAAPADPVKNKVDNVPAYINPVVLAAVRVARREGIAAGEPDKTYDELLVDALERVPLEEIRAIFAPEDAEAGGLLQRRKRRSRGTGGTQIQLRITGAQEDELTELAASVGAPSRSAFVNEVYRMAYLKE
ncbi:hypothetical protein E0W80_15815 [Microbacterium sp. PI-1]|uniref:hypothetical protein n=1 Tax=Microbacterium sp. PI-1 TaxID=2545631 RepID=UPI00103D3CD4|nr:hypothetical protein [Microbacterium sp. PI-1]TCJ21805.1 hypothetical protein E0W80_15815 [Microbacterium sp. PI-1]